MKRKGFTLIELLVVISIISLLSSIVLVSLSKARKQGRDARRVSDIRQIRMALELYFDVARNYPAGGTIWADLVTAGVMSVTPKDPLSSATGGTCRQTNYCYASRNDAGYINMGYHLGAMLELTETPALLTKRGCNSSLPSACGVTNAVYVNTPFNGTAALLYDVVP